MGEILADAVAFLEHFVERRRDHGRFRIVFELGADPVHQVDRAGKDAASRRKAWRRIGGDRLLHRHQRTGKDVTDRRGRTETGGLECHVADALPCRTWRGAGRGAAGNRNPRPGIDAKVAMRGFDQDALGMGAEKVVPYGAVRRPRPDIDDVRDQLLSVAAPRLQPQRAAREADRAFVAVGGDVANVVDHARPVSFSGRLALGPCGK